MILEINLDRLKEGENLIEFTPKELEEIEFEEYETFFENPLKVRIEKRNKYLYLTANTTLDVNLFCDKCTDEFAKEIIIDMEYVYYLGEYQSNNNQDIIEIPSKQHSFFIDKELKETLELNIPFVKVCFEGCKGLCFECGTNLNEKICECSKKKKIDPRWEKLAELAEKMKNDNN